MLQTTLIKQIVYLGNSFNIPTQFCFYNLSQFTIQVTCFPHHTVINIGRFSYFNQS